MEDHRSEDSRPGPSKKGQRSILVVYDEREVISTLSSLFKRSGYAVAGADDGLSAVDIFVAMGGFDLVLARRTLPDVDEEALRRMITDLYPDTKFLICEEVQIYTGATNHFLRLLMKDLTISGGELLELVAQVFSGNLLGSTRESSENENLKRCLLSVITLFSSYLEQYEFVTGGKGRFIKDFAVAVARQMGLPCDMVDEIAFTSLVFDIGMVRVSPRVKLKPADLSEDELVQIKSHCFYGAEIVEKMKFPWDIASIVLHHHERYDGKGYPRGLKGREIPIGARIIAVADAFYAMTSRRPNRHPLTIRQASEELRKGAGTQFDPEIVEIFLSLVRRKGLEEHDSDTPSKVVMLAGFSAHASALIAKRFDQAGHLTLHSGSREDLKEKLSAAPPDFLICDVQGIDGETVNCKKLRKEFEMPSLPALWLANIGSPFALDMPSCKGDADYYMTRPARLQEIVAEVNAALLRSDFKDAGPGATSGRDVYGIHGNLIELNITEIVQMLHQGGKTAEVTLTNGEDDGKIYFAAGHVRHAEFNKLAGERAFFEIIKLKDGDFTIEHTRTPPTVTIERRTDFLLLDAMRRLDEEAIGGGPRPGSEDLSDSLQA